MPVRLKTTALRHNVCCSASLGFPDERWPQTGCPHHGLWYLSAHGTFNYCRSQAFQARCSVQHQLAVLRSEAKQYAEHLHSHAVPFGPTPVNALPACPAQQAGSCQGYSGSAVQREPCEAPIKAGTLCVQPVLQGQVRARTMVLGLHAECCQPV